MLTDFVADMAVGRMEPRERLCVLVNLGERKLIFAERLYNVEDSRASSRAFRGGAPLPAESKIGIKSTSRAV